MLVCIDFLILGQLYPLLRHIPSLQEIIQSPGGILWGKFAFKSKLIFNWGEIWEDLRNDSWWMYIISFPFACIICSMLMVSEVLYVKLSLQLLLLNYGGSGKTTKSPPFQKKTLMLIDGNMLKRYWNQENRRYGISSVAQLSLARNLVINDGHMCHTNLVEESRKLGCRQGF